METASAKKGDTIEAGMNTDSFGRDDFRKHTRNDDYTHDTDYDSEFEPSLAPPATYGAGRVA